MSLPQFLSATLLTILFATVSAAQQMHAGNLDLTARASASSEAESTKAENLVDGDITNTQWTAKDGTSPAETGVELNWPSVLQFREVAIRQEGSPKLSHRGATNCSGTVVENGPSILTITSDAMKGSPWPTRPAPEGPS